MIWEPFLKFRTQQDKNNNKRTWNDGKQKLLTINSKLDSMWGFCGNSGEISLEVRIKIALHIVIRFILFYILRTMKPEY